MQQFSPETVEALGNYVYALLDPRIQGTVREQIFYVGKGRGQRCFQHAAEAGFVSEVNAPDPKLDRIRAIQTATGAPPPIRIVAHGLSEDEVLRIEAILIGLLGTDGNKVGGHHGEDYDLPVDEVEGRYANPLKEADLGHRVLLVSLNGKAGVPPYPSIAAAELDNRVLGKWRISDLRANEVEYVIGVYRRLTKVVYRVESDNAGVRWRRVDAAPPGAKKPDWRRVFNGTRDADKEELWKNRRIEDSDGTLLTKFARQQGCKLVGTRTDH